MIHARAGLFSVQFMLIDPDRNTTVAGERFDLDPRL